MKIVVVSAYYPSHGGGVELASERLVLDLASGGHDVRWIAHADGALPEATEVSCCPVKGTDAVYRQAGVPMPIPAPGALAPLTRHIRWSDLVIVAEANFIVCAVAFLLAKLLRRRVVLIQHLGKPATVSRIAIALASVAEHLFVRPMMKAADRVVFVSPWVASHFRDVRLRCPAVIIGHAIDTALFKPALSTAEKIAKRRSLGLPVRGNIACFVGRLTETKGISVIEAMARQTPGWLFVIVGAGPIDPESWGLANVRKLGQLSADMVAQVYQASDVFVLPSQSESFSLVVREALASGCGVICASQILQTDQKLADFVSTAEVDLTNIEDTARRFMALLDGERGGKSVAGRTHIIRECATNDIRKCYLELVDEAVPFSAMAALT